MPVRFIYLVLSSGIAFYHNVDPEFRADFQEEILGGLLAAFQNMSEYVFKSSICKVYLDNYSILIRQAKIQQVPVSLMVGTDTTKVVLLDLFCRQFMNGFQALVHFFHIDLNRGEVSAEFRISVDRVYNDLRQSICI